MPITTSMSMSGFIASDPATSTTRHGAARTYLRVGQEHHTRNQDGTFTQAESTFHDLILYGATAQRAAAQFKKGDRFLAEGYLHTWQAPDQNGVIEDREEFVARRIGHDTAYTTYHVDRTPRVQQGPGNGPVLPPAEAAHDLGMGI